MQIRIINWALVTVIISGFLFYGLAQTSQFEIKQLSEKSDVIITGKVTQQNASWNESRTRIYTYATIQVDEYLKGGNTGNSIVVSYPGGEVGDIGEFYTHTPKFVNNEEVLVFLKKDKAGSSYKVVNGEEGKLTVISDAKTGEKITSQNVRVNTLTAQIKNYVND